MTDADLDDILACSSRNNVPDEITGMLLYSRGSFMQVLEGPRDALERTFARISADPRHTQLFVLERTPITARSFDRFSMGFKRLGRHEAEQHPHFAPFFERGFDAASIGASAGMALAILTGFAQSY